MAEKFFTPFSVRIPDGLLDKLKSVAKISKRSTNKQVEFILEKFVEEWEAENGPLPPWEP